MDLIDCEYRDTILRDPRLTTVRDRWTIMAMQRIAAPSILLLRMRSVASQRGAPQLRKMCCVTERWAEEGKFMVSENVTS